MDAHRIVVGLGFGDEGKGTMVDHLCALGWARGGRAVRAVIRFNGGGQAAHNVVKPDLTHHTFGQFGSGTLDGVPTFLSRFMIVDPAAFAWERLALLKIGAPTDRVTVDPDCLVTTPYHKASNIFWERINGHGSCGAGVGETQRIALKYPEMALRVRHLSSFGETSKRLKWLQQWAAAKGDIAAEVAPWTVAMLIDCYRNFLRNVTVASDNALRDLLRSGPCVFEGAQGVLLDEDFGFHPHTTWSKTTPTNALVLLAEARQENEAVKMGVIRSYTTRHGAGPFPSEDFLRMETEQHNKHEEHQGMFRCGDLDLVATKYAIDACNGIDELAVTHMDALDFSRPNVVVRSYDLDGSWWEPTLPTSMDEQEALTQKMWKARANPTLVSHLAFTQEVSDKLRMPVAVQSYGPTTSDKEWRR